MNDYSSVISALLAILNTATTTANSTDNAVVLKAINVQPLLLAIDARTTQNDVPTKRQFNKVSYVNDITGNETRALLELIDPTGTLVTVQGQKLSSHGANSKINLMFSNDATKYLGVYITYDNATMNCLSMVTIETVNTDEDKGVITRTGTTIDIPSMIAAITGYNSDGSGTTVAAPTTSTSGTTSTTNAPTVTTTTTPPATDTSANTTTTDTSGTTTATSGDSTTSSNTPTSSPTAS